MRNADRHNAVRQRWPQKAAALQPLREQTRALAVMPNDLDQVAAAASKNVEITSVRIPLQTLLSQMRKAPEHMTTEHTVVRSGKLKRKPFNSNVADYLLTIATFAFSYPLVLSDTSNICICAFTVVAPGVRFNAFAIFLAPAFCFARGFV